MQGKRRSWFNALWTAVVTVAAVTALGSAAHADPITPAWNPVGDYGWEYDFGNILYDARMDITSMDSTGAFTALMNPGLTLSNGHLQGSSISFDLSGGPCFSGNFQGTVASNGTLAGNLQVNNCHGEWSGFWFTTSGHALPLGLPAFEILEYVGGENCPKLPPGSTGCFVFVNNTNIYDVTGFLVGNPQALADSTTRANWYSDITAVNYGSGPETSFRYGDEGGAAFNPIGFGSYPDFFYTTGAGGSPFEVFATGPNGEVSCTGFTGGGCDLTTEVPEPNTMAMIVGGLAALSLTVRKKLRRAAHF